MLFSLALLPLAALGLVSAHPVADKSDLAARKVDLQERASRSLLSAHADARRQLVVPELAAVELAIVELPVRLRRRLCTSDPRRCQASSCPCSDQENAYAVCNNNQCGVKCKVRLHSLVLC